MIFGSAQVDLVPWELAIKSFRALLGDTQFATVSEYLDDLFKYLSGNDSLFPDAVRKKLVEFYFDDAMVEVMKRATQIDGTIVEAAFPLADRQDRWAAAATTIRNDLQTKGAQSSLPSASTSVACRSGPLDSTGPEPTSGSFQYGCRGSRDLS